MEGPTKRRNAHPTLCGLTVSEWNNLILCHVDLYSLALLQRSCTFFAHMVQLKARIATLFPICFGPVGPECVGKLSSGLSYYRNPQFWKEMMNRYFIDDEHNGTFAVFLTNAHLEKTLRKIIGTHGPVVRKLAPNTLHNCFVIILNSMHLIVHGITYEQFDVLCKIPGPLRPEQFKSLYSSVNN